MLSFAHEIRRDRPNGYYIEKLNKSLINTITNTQSQNTARTVLYLIALHLDTKYFILSICIFIYIWISI